MVGQQLPQTNKKYYNVLPCPMRFFTGSKRSQLDRTHFSPARVTGLASCMYGDLQKKHGAGRALVRVPTPRILSLRGFGSRARGLVSLKAQPRASDRDLGRLFF